MKIIELGDKVKDKVSGFSGIVVAITQYLTGCDRALVDAGCDKDGKMREAENIDVLTLRIVKKQAVVIEIEKQKKSPPKKTGGSYDIPKINRY